MDGCNQNQLGNVTYLKNRLYSDVKLELHRDTNMVYWSMKWVVPEWMSYIDLNKGGERSLNMIAFVSKVFPSVLDALTKGG